ncbi:8440_t:CDS:2 [Gigaspora rosea]|nr:8440_t:CDS:2 [Gigaspora rosea]
MNELSLPTDSAVKSKIVWRPLFSNLRCIQVPLTEVPSVIDLYTFDTVSSGGGSLSEGYTILSQNCTNNGQLREGDIKSITLIDKDTKYLSNSTLA